MNKLTTSKRIWSIFLTLAMVLTMSVTALPSYAADSNKINIVYNPQVQDLTSTPYTLYKVGSFDHYKDGPNEGKSYIALDESLTGEGIPNVNGITVPEDTSDINSSEYVAWEKNWLDAADSIAKFLSTNTSAANKLKKGAGNLKVQPGAQDIGTYERGIYLLVGEKVRVGNTYWWPVPVLIQVLNSDVEFSIAALNEQDQEMRYNEVKMQSKPVIYKHIVSKHWDAESPASTRGDVRVGIYYGEGDAQETVDFVTLKYDGENPQSYIWYSTEQKNGDKITVNYYDVDPDVKVENESGEMVYPDPKKSFEVDKSSTWLAKEMRETVDERAALAYYESEIKYSMDGAREADTSSWDASKNREEAINITNTFKQAKLVINKDLKSYLDQSSANAMVVFEVTGKVAEPQEEGSEEAAAEKVVYHNQVAMAFTGPGTKALTLDNLPVNLDSLEVKEIYATNYKVDPAGSDTIDVDLSTGQMVDGVLTYTVNFTNVYDNKTEYSKGIVNNYENAGDGFVIVNRDDGKDNQAEQ